MFDLAMATFIQMLPHLLSFIVLAYLLSWLLYKPVKNILQTRANKIEADIQDAAENKAAATELKKLYDEKYSEINAERNAILEEARKEADTRVAKIMGDAKAEALGLRERAKRDISTEKERVKEEIYQAIVDISIEMAAKIVAGTIDRQGQDKLFEEAMSELEATVFEPS